MSSAVTIDFAEAERFRRCILGDDPRVSGLWIQLPDHELAADAFDERDDAAGELIRRRPQQRAHVGRLIDRGTQEWLTEGAQLGWGCFLTLHAMGGRRRRLAANCSRVRVYCVDGDRGEPPLDDWGPVPPDLVHQRMGARKWAAYWRIADGDDEQARATWGAVQAHLASRFHGDPQVIDLSRVMRITGTPNCKDPLCPDWYRVVEDRLDVQAPRSWRDLVTAWGLNPDDLPIAREGGVAIAGPRGAGELSTVDRQVLVVALRDLIDRYSITSGLGLDGASRHGALLGWVGDAVASGMEADEVRELVGQALVHMGRAETPGEIDRMIEAADRHLGQGTWTVGLHQLGVVFEREFADPPDDDDVLREVGRPAVLEQGGTQQPTTTTPTEPAEPAYTPEKSLARRRARTGALLSSDAPANGAELLACDWRDPHTGGTTLLRWRETDYRWDGTSWRPLGGEDLDAWVQQRCAGCGLTQSAIQSTTRALRRLATFASDDLQLPCWIDWERRRRDHDHHDDNVVAFRNGVLDVDAWIRDPRTTVRPATPEWFAVGCSPYDFDPSAQCPRWSRFLHEIWPDPYEYAAQVPLLQQWAGYLLVSSNRAGKFLVLQGRPRSGKSTIQYVLERMLGDHLTCSLGLSDWGGRFGMADVPGRHLVTLSDTNDGSRPVGEMSLAVDRLKAITGGDYVSVEPKGKGLSRYRLGARVLVVSNRVPRLIDRSSALYARMLLITCNRTRSEQEQDKGLWKALAAELPGIVLWALEGLRELQAAEWRFQENAWTEDYKRTLQQQDTPVSLWVEEALAEEQGAVTRIEDALAAHRAWSLEQGRRPLCRDALAAEVVSLLPKARYSRITVEGSATRVRALVGIRLTEEGRTWAESARF